MDTLLNFFWPLIRRVLFWFDAESVHHLSLGILKRLGTVRISSGASGAVERSTAVGPLMFRNRLGLAAGFDKNAEALEAVARRGFGFAEIGTVTPLPQVGNPRPRLFRIPEQTALFNRMGFNNLGAEAIAWNVQEARPRLPRDFRIGLNVGKNKDTPLEVAHLDYQRAVKPFRGNIDYVVVNVSSPNTPGLRSLQSEKSLSLILQAVRDEIEAWSTRPPLFVKLAPELLGEAMSTLLPVLEREGADGFVLTNTLMGEWKGQTGGWSGMPVQSLARLALSEARQISRKPIISVGGILTIEEARVRLDLGADLIQIYAGWIYGGPNFPAEVVRSLPKD